MIISEKGLTRALKKAYKAGGYVLVNGPDQVVIYTRGWYIRGSWPKFPVKALATIVEHMGSLPTEEGGLEIIDGAEPQHIMAEKVGEDVAFWESDAAAVATAGIVPLTFMAASLFQTPAGACYGVSQTPLGIVEDDVIEKETATVMKDYRLKWEAEEEKAVVLAVRPSENYEAGFVRDVWTALEGIDLRRPTE